MQNKIIVSLAAYILLSCGKSNPEEQAFIVHTDFESKANQKVLIFGKALESGQNRFDSILVETNGKLARIPSENLQGIFLEDLESNRFKFLDLDFDGQDELIVDNWERRSSIIFQSSGDADSWVEIQTDGMVSDNASPDSGTQSFVGYTDDISQDYRVFDLENGKAILKKEVSIEEIGPYTRKENIKLFANGVQTGTEVRVVSEMYGSEMGVENRKETITEYVEIKEFLLNYRGILGTYEYSERDEERTFKTFSNSDDCYTKEIEIIAGGFGYEINYNAVFMDFSYEITELRIMEWGTVVEFDVTDDESQASSTIRYYYEPFELEWIPCMKNSDGGDWTSADLFMSSDYTDRFRTEDCQFDADQDYMGD